MPDPTPTREPTPDDVTAAAARIQGAVHRTPVITCSAISDRVGAEVFLKCENLQKVGAFKFRGATNAVRMLTPEEASRGVATHSSGNHAAALALAARQRGIPAYVVMPRTAPPVKRAAVAGYGAQIILCEPTLAAREASLLDVVRQTRAAVVHPYNDARVIAGQGTAALELLADVPGLDLVVTPVGGGGLLSGTALAVRGASPRTRVAAAEPAGADDAARSVATGRLQPSVNPQTICDGLLTSLCDLTFGIIRRAVEQIVTVSDASVIAAMRLLLERAKLLVEPSGAIPLGALLEGKLDVKGARVGLILSGGNADLDRPAWLSR
jgi:threonine dehydratase